MGFFLKYIGFIKTQGEETGSSESGKMNIAIKDIYGSLYTKDRIFDINASNIGENLLLPGIELKKSLEVKGHQYHTADMYAMRDIDVIVFQEIPRSWYTISTLWEKVKYIIKGNIFRDTLLHAIWKIPKQHRILMIMEPEVVAEKSYNQRYHKYFGKVLTWNDELVDDHFYYKMYYPQPTPCEKYYIEFSKKQKFTMICGNKMSHHVNELYSERRKVIEYFESHEEKFDLYGVGWQQEKLRNYKGKIPKKLEVLSHYKYAFCFENQCNTKGYVTEKIFDCFFANCVPIYWGADNIQEYVPENTFIDWRNFGSIEELLKFIDTIDEKIYNCYLENIKSFLQSDVFTENFSVKAYIDRMERYLLD